MLRFASLFFLSVFSLLGVSFIHYAKYVFLKILTFVKSFINQHLERQTKIF